MRVIRFRIWDGGKMLEWSHLYPHYHALLLGMMNDEKDEDSSFALMQYTGLKDKNGKEIYEGDIMKVLDRDWSDMEKDTKTFIVYYDRDSFILTNKVGIKERESGNPNQYNKDWHEAKLSREYGRDRFEIIGNIYENPELLNHVDTTN